MKLFYALILCSLSFISIHAQNRSVESIGFADVIVMEVSPSGNVWVGSVTQGCSAYIASSHTWSTFTTLNSSMESDSITCIALYAINTVPHSFMGTTHGIGYRHGTTWDTLAGLIDPRVVDIIRSGADHRLYVATAGGISMYNDTLLTHTTDYSAGSASLPHANITCFQSKPMGPAGFYYGTADSGYFYSPDGVAYTWTGVANANLADNRVNCLFANTAGTTVYAGTKGGLSICAAGTCTGFTTASGLPQNDVTAVDVDCRGFVWVGTRDSGLAVYDTLQHTWSYIKAAQGLPSNRITAVNCSTSCDCYIGTLDGGAIIVDTTQTLKQLPTAAAEIRQAAASVRVFPQPAADVLHVTTENIYGAGQIYLYDISGKLVLGQSVALDKAFSVNVSDLDNGFYFYRISGQNKVLATGKIVLSR